MKTANDILTRPRKAAYGSADFGMSAAELLVQFYLFEFYTSVLGLSPLLTGLALGIAVLWDAVSDPLMGMICDRTRSSWGRFVPYLALGGLALPLTLFMLFNPPEIAQQAGLFAWLLCSYLLLNTAMTILGVPHMALGASLSADTHERTEIFGWKLIFGTLGLFLGILAPLVVATLYGMDVTQTEDLGRSRGAAALLVGFSIVLTVALTLFSVARRSVTLSEEQQAPIFTWQTLIDEGKAILTNRFFLPLLMAFVLVAIARAMNATLALPFYKFTLELTEAEIQKWVLGVFSICILLSAAVWTVLGRRYGKKWPAFSGLLTLGLLTVIAYPLFPPGQLVGPLIAAVIGGLAVGAIILFESLVTDVAARDRNQGAWHREGMYFGFWRMGQKLARSVGLILVALVTHWIGLDVDAVRQTEETARRLAWVFGPGVGSFFIVAALVFMRMPQIQNLNK
ncbi:MAG: MFS transporter [Verrucomicrobia bacterium]|nr:MFS transporter [Verrucomicrobiota bacterium]